MNNEIVDNRDRDFPPDPALEKANNDSPIFICTQCGECCHIREKKDISPEHEAKYMTAMFKKFGIIYLADINDITINIWPEERDELERQASLKKVDLSIRPKRAYYNKKNDELVILDYYIDADICPFFDRKTKLCGIYESRPQICRSYPLLTLKNLGKCRFKKKDPDAYGSEKIEAEKLDNRIIAQKKILYQLILNNEVDINEMISGEEIDRLFKENKVKELRI